MATRMTILTDARAEALFASDLSAWSQPTRADVEAAIRHAVRRYGGIRGCLGQVAAEYGDHPDGAVRRMRWARRIVSATYGNPPQDEITVRRRPGTLALAA
ncbi:hypothetical protein V6U89_16785 [Micromonospora sp. CPCC 206171]|uniref:hypothetical protein n=1 Tax=Micromonospora sp. CPCC 206171 TaxID=3122405 RepID=UPI002FF0C817